MKTTHYKERIDKNNEYYSVADKNNLEVLTQEIENSYWGRPSKWISIIFRKK